MPRPLTAVAVASVKPQAGKRTEIADGSTPGLYLVVQPSGAKSWAFRYKTLGNRVKLTLGPASGPGAMSLAEARQRAGEARRQLGQGVDPSRARKDARAAEVARIEAEKRAAEAETKRDHLRMEAIVEAYISRHVEPHLKSMGEVTRLLRKEIAGPWRGRLITGITRKDVVDLVDDIAARGARTTANRTLANVKALFGWAVDRGLVDTSPCIKVRPPSPETARDRVLSDNELQLVLLGIERLEWPWRQFFKIVLLTGQRREEVAGMRWAELEGLGGGALVWVLPAARTKNGREHAVPLAPAVAHMLRSAPRIDGSDYVFTTGRRRQVGPGDDGRPAPVSGFSKAKKLLDAAITDVAREQGASGVGAWIVHDLRRTAASGMARLGVQLPVIEKVLNHVSGSFAGVVGVYQRHSYAEEKRVALQIWAKHCEMLSDHQDVIR